jgi:hypothetical protein
MATVATLVITAGPVSASTPGPSVTLHAPGHALEIGKIWIATAAVTHNGEPISGQVRYQMLAAKQVEATEPWVTFTHGSAREVLHTPNNALDRLAAKLKIPFTIHFEFRTRYGTASADWIVKVIR